MTPKKPTLTAARKAWLASLKPGDSSLVWRDFDGWHTCKVISVGGRILVRSVVRIAFWGDSVVSRGAGIATDKGDLSAAIFPSDDRDALAAFRADEHRRALRNVDWRKVDDSTVQRIADMLRLDAGKEPAHDRSP